MLDLLSETGKLAAKSCQSLMAQNIHLTREKTNCLKTLRDIEGWLGS